MAIGSFFGECFTVSDRQILTFKGLAGSAGSDWAEHSIVGGKPKSQWVGPKLRSYKFELVLRAQDGVRPRSTINHFQVMAESNRVDYFIVGNAPISPFPFKITDVSDSWDVILNQGELIACKVSLTIEEYL